MIRNQLHVIQENFLKFFKDKKNVLIISLKDGKFLKNKMKKWLFEPKLHHYKKVNELFQT